MAFNPALPTLLDRIRMIVGDTSNDPETELFPDETYNAKIAEYQNWKLAAAEMAEAIAVQIEQDPTSFTAVGDMSVAWTDRTRSLRATAARLRSEAASEGVTVSNVIESIPLVRDGAGRGGEYRPERYRRLRR